MHLHNVSVAVGTLFIGALMAGPASAQDAMAVAGNHYKVLVDNDQVRVVECTLAPGDKDPVHTHPANWYYITKPGTLKAVYADGKVVTEEGKMGDSGWQEAEGPHTAENVGTTTLQFILVEVKSAARNLKK